MSNSVIKRAFMNRTLMTKNTNKTKKAGPNRYVDKKIIKKKKKNWKGKKKSLVHNIVFNKRKS